MNRKQPGRPLRAPLAFRRIAAAYRCPDCDSETGEPQPDDLLGIWRMEVRHDETCPWYRQHIVGSDTPKAAP